MKIFLSGGLIAAVLMFCAVADGQERNCDWEKSLREYLDHHDEAPMRVAALDHTTGEWHAFTWDGQTLHRNLRPPAFVVPASNDPTLVVTSDGRAGVFLVDTNPLLYAAKQKAVTVQDIDSIADLKKLLGLFGGFISSSIQIGAARHTVDVETLASAAGLLHKTQHEILSQPIPKKLEEPLRLARNATDLANHLELHKESVAKATVPLLKEAKDLEKVVTSIGTARDAITLQLQLIENAPGSFSRESLRKLDIEPESIVTALAELEGAANDAAAVSVPCPGTVDALRQALLWKIDGVPEAHFDSVEYRERWDKIIGTLQSARSECKDEDVAAPILEIGRWLATHPPQNRPSDTSTATALLPLFKAADGFTAAVKKRDGAVTAAKGVLGKSSQAVRQSVQIARFLELRDERKFDRDGCQFLTGVIPVRIIEYDDLKVGPTQVRNEEFTVTVRPTFASEVERRRDDVAGKFHLRRNALDIDLDTGVTYTTVSERTFAAIKDGEADTTFTIREKDRKTRAGQVALFATFGQDRPWGVGGQIGFGLDTSNPALFTGVAVRLGRYAKVSIGETFQRVTKLRKGQFVGKDDLTSADELATRDGWSGRPYIALSLTLDNLPIFGGGGE